MTENTDTTEHEDSELENVADSHDSEEQVGRDFPGDADATPAANAAPDEEETEETFPREYVEKLRDENAKYRQRAQRADDLAHRLHTELVRATGRLADPTDLEFDEGHLEDPDALTAAIEDLLARKPHLASRTPRGDVGQGRTGTETVDLASILRAAAS